MKLSIRYNIMRLGVAYNVFDGAELLEGSIKQMREIADFICIVWQRNSNFGEAIPSWSYQYLMECVAAADNSYGYTPSVTGGHRNEIIKRNIGANLCREAHCSHFITMDADEYYDVAQLKRIKDLMVTGDYDSSACQMQTYYGSPEYALDPPEAYYVPLIYKLDEREFALGNQMPVAADPTRKLPARKFIAFDRNEIEMHHFSYLRKDMGLKLRNSSALPNFRDKLDKIQQHYESWEPGEQGLLAGKEDRYYNLKLVENKFNIKLREFKFGLSDDSRQLQEHTRTRSCIIRAYKPDLRKPFRVVM